MFKKGLFILLIGLIQLINSSDLMASHITGSDFSYQCIGNDSFLITFNVFRDCDGISLGQSVNFDVENSCGTSSVVTANLISTGQQEVSQVCGPWKPLTTCQGGTLDGMEVWIYTAIVVLDPSCGGEATVSVSGGTSGYSYSWPMQLNSSTVSDLCAGSYPVLITDGNGCQITDTTSFIDSSGLYLSGVINQISCSGLCDASITVTPNMGQAPYSFHWEDGTPDSSRTNLCPGFYSVTVMDANGNQYAYFATIDQKFPINISQTVTDESCNAACDGFIRTDITGGTAPYTLNWSGGLIGKTNSNVCAGSYSLTVTDANGCVGTSSVTVNSGATVLTSHTINDTVSCVNACDGMVTVSGSGGVAPYSYLWSNGNTGAIASGLCAGVYSVTVADANGCTSIETFTLASPSAILGGGTVTNSVCAGTTGAIALSASGGAGSYSYNWSVIPNPGNVNLVNNLAAGYYYVTITDASGCFVVEGYAVNNTTGPNASGAVVANPSCFNGSNGAISIAPAGGLAPYTYLWSTGGTTNAISALVDAEYVVTITDANGCKLIESYDVVSPDSIETNGTFSPPTCAGVCNASISLNPVGGSGGYNLSWSNGGTGLSQTNLCAGSYGVTVTDGNGCQVVDTFIISNPAVLQDSVIVHDTVSCFGDCNGQLEVIAFGGVAPYTYTWSNGDVTTKAYDLCAGVHYVTITDAGGCQIVDTINMTQPTQLVSSITQNTGVSCSGLWQFDWDLCCRPNNPQAVNIAAASNSMWAGATMNQTMPQGQCNNGVQFTTDSLAFPLRYVCQNDSLCYSMGATEADGDSVVFSFEAAREDLTTPVIYVAPYSAQQPILGITIDSAAGEVCFAATTLGRFVVTVKAQEYDPVTGLYKGETVRDILFIVETCAANTAPTATNIINFDSTGGASLVDSLGIQMCEGDSFCFDVTFRDSGTLDTGLYVFSNVDQVLVGPNPNDTATIINSTLDTVYVNGDTLLEITSTICWRAPVGSQGNYNFFIKGDDDHCKIPSDVFRTINVQVSGSTVAWPDAIICGNQTSQIYAGGGNWFSWQAISGDPIIVGVNFSCDSCTTPVASPTQTTTYVVTTDFLGACGNTDTVTITVAPDFIASAEPDTILCNTDSIQLSALASIPGVFSYQWSEGQTMDNDTIQFPMAHPMSTTTYSVTMTSGDGCVKSTTTDVVITPPFPILDPFAIDSALCFGGDTSQIDIDFLNYQSSSCTLSQELCQNAVSNYSVGTGTTGNTSFGWPAPFGNSRRSAKHQMLFLASELTAQGMSGGMITEISFDVLNINGLSSYSDFDVKIGCTALTSLTAVFQTGLSQVVSGASVNLNTGWTTITFDVPYLWDGTSNIIIETCFLEAANSNTQNTSVRNSTTTFTSCLMSNSFNSTACAATSATGAYFQRPNIRFGTCDTPVPAAYTYAWSPNYNISDTGIINPQAWPDSTTTYSVMVNDTFGVCFDSASVTITIGDLFAGNDTIICAGDSVTILDSWVQGGCATAGDTFTWTNGHLMNDSTILNPTISVSQTTDFVLTYTNSCGCLLSDTLTIIVNPLSPPSTTQTPPTCGQNNGAILVQGIGGNAPYSYSIDSGLTFTVDSLFIGLTTDTFDVQVIDSFGCLSPIYKDTLINPGAPVIDSIVTTDPLCFGDQNGEIQIFATGGTQPLMFSIDSVNFGFTNTLTNLPEGTYTVVVRDDSLCYTWPQYIELESNTELLLDSVSSQNPFCYQDGTGQIEVHAHGGTPPLEYSIDNGATYSLNPVFPGLSGGNYFVLVRDSVNCYTNMQAITIVEPDPFIVSVAPSNDTCFNACGGSAQALVTGGTGLISYSWNVGGVAIGTNDSVIDRLCADNAYTLTITDANGCTADNSFSISQPSELILSETVYNVSCFGKTDGRIELSAIGGNTPYWFSIDSGLTYQSSPVFNNLASGTYHAFVRDSNYMCFDYTQITLLEPSEVVIQTNTTLETLCVSGCTTLVASASGGIGAPYNFLWNNGLDSNGTQLVCPKSKTTIFSVYAADANGCTSSAVGITINLNDSLSVDAGQDLDMCKEDTVSLNASVVGGSGSGYQYLWTPLAGLSNGYIQNPLVSPAVSTLYQVKVMDDCESPAAFDSVWVRVHDDPVMDFIALDSAAGCEPFDVTLLNNSSPVQYAEWTIGGDISATGLKVDITDLLEGTYDVKLRVITPNGCEGTITKKEFVTVYPLPEPNFKMDPEQTTIYKTIVQLTDLSEGNIQEWQWDFAGYGSSNQQNPLFQFPVDTGSYPVSLIVTTDKMCEEEVIKYLRVGDEYNMYIPNSFTPNGDGQNDVFAPVGIGVDPNQYKLQVYDRWGTLIFESSSLNMPWDGSNQNTGKMVQNGVYVWQLVATDGTDDPESHQYKGTVTVIK